MPALLEPAGQVEATSLDRAAEIRHERWMRWPIHWNAVWVGALAAFAAVLIFGLIGLALGAHLVEPENRLVELRKMGAGALIFSICGAFFAFAIAAWVAGKIAGILHAEPAMLQGAVVWLVAVPMLMAAAGLGAGSLMGGWYAGLGNRPGAAANLPFVRPEPPGFGATAEDVSTYRAQRVDYERNLRQWNEDSPKVARNVAIGTVAALLLGLIGSVIGGWMASGEPMNFKHYKTRKPLMYHTA